MAIREFRGRRFIPWLKRRGMRASRLVTGRVAVSAMA